MSAVRVLNMPNDLLMKLFRLVLQVEVREETVESVDFHIEWGLPDAKRRLDMKINIKKECLRQEQ